jgi:hypothetical protein
MQIGCTKNLLDYIGIKPTPADMSADPVLSWSANLINIGHRKVIVAAHDSSRCGFVLYGIKAGDVKKLDSLMTDGIRACLESECINPELIERYMADCGEVSFTKTANRTAVARLNKLCKRSYYYAEDFTTDTLLQKDILPSLNNDLVTDRSAEGKGYFSTYEKLAEDLSGRYGMYPYRCRAAELEVELELESTCRRRIIVPMNYTFRRFHNALQKLFCWQGYHLHDFWIEQYPNKRLKYTLVGTPREDEYEGETTRPDWEVLLSDIFPTYDHIIYNYDFGDDWIHHIKLVSIIDNYNKNHPVCLSGEGDAPPEDVGGPSGYAEMLRVLADPKDPEYESMKIWVDGMRWKKFDIENINRDLKFLSKR